MSSTVDRFRMGAEEANPPSKINAPASSSFFSLLLSSLLSFLHPPVPPHTSTLPLPYFTHLHPFSSITTPTATFIQQTLITNGGSFGKVSTPGYAAILLCGARRLSSLPCPLMGHRRPVSGRSPHHHPDSGHGPFLLRAAQNEAILLLYKVRRLHLVLGQAHSLRSVRFFSGTFYYDHIDLSKGPFFA